MTHTLIRHHHQGLETGQHLLFPTPSTLFLSQPLEAPYLHPIPVTERKQPKGLHLQGNHHTPATPALTPCTAFLPSSLSQKCTSHLKIPIIFPPKLSLGVSSARKHSPTKLTHLPQSYAGNAQITLDLAHASVETLPTALFTRASLPRLELPESEVPAFSVAVSQMPSIESGTWEV